MSNVYDYVFATKSGDLSDIDYDDAIWRLREYEDTDLTPQQIKDMQFCLREKSRECAELRKRIRELEEGGKDKDSWIPVEERLPEERVNPVSQDFYEYQVTAKFGNVKDVRHYKYGNGHWWHGAGIVDEYVIAWRENPETCHSERSV